MLLAKQKENKPVRARNFKLMRKIQLLTRFCEWCDQYGLYFATYARSYLLVGSNLEAHYECGRYNIKFKTAVEIFTHQAECICLKEWMLRIAQIMLVIFACIEAVMLNIFVCSIR